MKIQIIIGSTRQNRVGDKVAKEIYEQLKVNELVTFELLDLRDYALPFFDEPSPPIALNGNYSSEVAKKWVAKIAEADGYIIVTPEYNHSYPAVLKNAFDYAFKEWGKKPAWIISYSRVITGGARAIEHLIPILSYMQLMPVKTTVISQVAQYINEEGDFKGEKLQKEITSGFEQFLWWAELLKSGRELNDNRMSHTL